METRLYEIQGSEFYMSISYHISQLMPRGIAVFLLKHFIFLENGKNCHSIVFAVLQIHVKTESLKADSHVSRNHLLLTTQFGTQVKCRWSRDRNDRTAENAFSAPWFFSEMELEPAAG